LLAHLAVADMSIALSSATVRVGPRRSSPIQCRAATGGNRDLPRERPPSRSSTVYGTACAACHGTDLKGVTGLPDMPSLNRDFFEPYRELNRTVRELFPRAGNPALAHDWAIARPPYPVVPNRFRRAAREGPRVHPLPSSEESVANLTSSIRVPNISCRRKFVPRIGGRDQPRSPLSFRPVAASNKPIVKSRRLIRSLRRRRRAVRGERWRAVRGEG
jgi:hypothetical protein